MRVWFDSPKTHMPTDKQKCHKMREVTILLGVSWTTHYKQQVTFQSNIGNMPLCFLLQLLRILHTTSSDHLLIMHLSLENSCAQVLWLMSDDFYIKRSTILLAFQRCQHFLYHQDSLSCNFHFYDTTPT